MDDSLVFLRREHRFEGSSDDIIKEHNKLTNFIQSIPEQLENDSTTNWSLSIATIHQKLNNISQSVGSLYYHSYKASPRLTAAKEIEKLFTSSGVKLFNNYEKFLNLFSIYMEFIVESAWFDDLSAATNIIKKLEQNNNIDHFKELFHVSKKMIEVSKLMIHKNLYWERYELNFVFRAMRAKENYKDYLYFLLFKLIVHTKKSYDDFLLENGQPTETIFGIQISRNYQYSEEFSKAIGLLYFSDLQKADPKIWDLANYPGVFLDIIHFERKHVDEIKLILDVYKKSDFKTQQAIAYELRAQSSTKELVEKLENFLLFKKLLKETQLLYSEIYFTGGQDIQWANFCQNKGYLIIRYSEHWVSLYNTRAGHLRNETGILFDAKLLDSTKKNLTFKVLKRDGWHFYESSRGLHSDAWDDIQLLTTSVEYRNYPGYFVGVKDKVFYLFKSDETKPIKIFDKNRINEINFFTHWPSPFFAIRIKKSYQLFDLKNDCLVENFPSNVEAVEFIQNSDRYMILTLNNKKRFIYSLNERVSLIHEGIKEVCFPSFSTDLVVKNTDESFSIIQSDNHQRKLSKEEFDGLSRYELADPRSLHHFESHGISFHENRTVIRYDFRMTLQGHYHITVRQGKNHLWLQNTVGGFRGTTLYQDADQITCLGISIDPYSDRKVFFLIEQKKELSLYVSYYDQLKALSDKKQNLTQNEAPHDLISLEGQKITFLHDNYFIVSQNEILNIYEYPFGFHNVNALEINVIDYKNFLKLKLGDLWYLYDLTERSLIDIEGANAIQLSAENKIVFIYDNYIQHLKYENIPKCAPAYLLEKTIKSVSITSSLTNNYLVNFTKFPEYSFVNLKNHNQSLVQMLMRYLDHQFLKECTPIFYYSLHELFDGKPFESSKIDHVNHSLKEKTLTVNDTKKSIRTLSKLISEEINNISLSFSLRKDLARDICSIKTNLLRLTDDLSKKFKNDTGITREIEKLNKKTQELSSCFSNKIVKQKKQEKENFLNILHSHPHLLAEILRYWFFIDPKGININSLYHALKALSNLHSRGINNQEVCDFIIRNHSLNLIKLYYFDSVFINNYVLSELWSIDPLKLRNLASLQELFALFDSLKLNSNEKEIFNIFCKKAPGLQPIYEDLEDEAQQHEEARYKVYLHILKLMAIANEIGMIDIYNLDLQSCKNHFEVIERLTLRLWSSFCYKLGIYIEEDAKIPFDIKFLIDLFYAYESLKNSDRTLFVVMLKAAIYQVDIKNLFINPISLDIKIKFSNPENQLLRKIQVHNQELKSTFENNGLNWNVWQRGIGQIEGLNIAVKSWGRNIEHDLFQGEFCNSCISLVKSNARANLYYLSDFNFSMIEIFEKKTAQSIGHITIWIAYNESKELVLVMNSFQFHSKFKKHGQEIRDLVFEYAQQLAFSLKIKNIVLGKENQDEELLSVLWQLRSGIFEDIENVEDVDEKPLSERNLIYQEKSSLQIENQTFSILHPLFSEEMYSDVYFDGWVTTAETYQEKPTVFNISLFLKQLSLFKKQHPLFPIENSLLDYEFWIINNPNFNYIKVCGDRRLIFISQDCLEKYTLKSIFNQIKNTLQVSQNFEDNILIHTNTLTLKDYIALYSTLWEKEEEQTVPIQKSYLL